MIKICEKAGVRYFRYHALRHFGASQLVEFFFPALYLDRYKKYLDTLKQMPLLEGVVPTERNRENASNLIG